MLIGQFLILVFAKTNVLGTLNLLNAFKSISEQGFHEKLFYHISTDEVYGTLGEKGLFTEQTHMTQTLLILLLKRVLTISLGLSERLTICLT